MGDTINIGITGYGNLGRGAESAIAQNPDMALVALVTRRDPATVTPVSATTPVVSFDEVESLRGEVDVMICCGGSKDDLPVQGPLLARYFNLVDSFDTHAKIPAYFASLDAPARESGTTAVLSTGWDPGLFSLHRLLGEAILPQGDTSTFWGRGLSQGHSDAVRRVPGVAAGVQYTIPSPDAMRRVRSGERPTLSTREKHTRECFVVLAEGADAAAVELAIVTMPDYFADYDTTVTFISRDELDRAHSAMPHGGTVLRNATTADGMEHTMEFGLALGHNPSFTASVMVAFARAAFRMHATGDIGAKTVFDVAPGLLSPRPPGDLRRDLL